MGPLVTRLRLLLFILAQIDLYSRKQPIDKEIFKENVETMTLPFLTRIIGISRQKENQSLSLIDDLGWEMIAFWRQLFLKFGEPVDLEQLENTRLIMPPEMKGKLTDLVTRSLEKEIKRAKIE